VPWDYRIERDAIKDLRDIGPSAANVIRGFLNTRIRGCDNPRAFGKPLRGDKHGLWRYRVQDYRIICRIEDDKLVVVVANTAHRKEVYD